MRKKQTATKLFVTEPNPDAPGSTNETNAATATTTKEVEPKVNDGPVSVSVTFNFDDKGNVILPDGTLVVEPTLVEENGGSTLMQFDFKDGQLVSSSDNGGSSTLSAITAAAAAAAAAAGNSSASAALSAANLDPGVLDTVKCTSCATKIDPYAFQVEVHPALRVIVCKRCRRGYGRGDFSQDDDGKDENCRWCAEGGYLVCCDACSNAFCKSCIKRNLGRTVLQSIEDLGDGAEWQCFVCRPDPIVPLQHKCAQVLESVRHYQDQKKRRSQRARRSKVASPGSAASTAVSGVVTPATTTTTVTNPATAAALAAALLARPGNRSSAPAPVSPHGSPAMTLMPRLVTLPSSTSRPAGTTGIPLPRTGTTVVVQQQRGGVSGSVPLRLLTSGTSTATVNTSAGGPPTLGILSSDWYKTNTHMDSILDEISKVQPSNIRQALMVTRRCLDAFGSDMRRLETELAKARTPEDVAGVVVSFQSIYRFHLFLRLGKPGARIEEEVNRMRTGATAGRGGTASSIPAAATTSAAGNGQMLRSLAATIPVSKRTTVQAGRVVPAPQPVKRLGTIDLTAAELSAVTGRAGAAASTSNAAIAASSAAVAAAKTKQSLVANQRGLKVKLFTNQVKPVTVVDLSADDDEEEEFPDNIPAPTRTRPTPAKVPAPPLFLDSEVIPELNIDDAPSNSETAAGKSGHWGKSLDSSVSAMNKTAEEEDAIPEIDADAASDAEITAVSRQNDSQISSDISIVPESVLGNSDKANPSPEQPTALSEELEINEQPDTSPEEGVLQIAEQRNASQDEDMQSEVEKSSEPNVIKVIHWSSAKRHGTTDASAEAPNKRPRFDLGDEGDGDAVPESSTAASASEHPVNHEGLAEATAVEDERNENKKKDDKEKDAEDEEDIVDHRSDKDDEDPPGGVGEGGGPANGEGGGAGSDLEPDHQGEDGGDQRDSHRSDGDRPADAAANDSTCATDADWVLRWAAVTTRLLSSDDEEGSDKENSLPRMQSSAPHTPSAMSSRNTAVSMSSSLSSLLTTDDDDEGSSSSDGGGSSWTPLRPHRKNAQKSNRSANKGKSAQTDKMSLAKLAARTSPQNRNLSVSDLDEENERARQLLLAPSDDEEEADLPVAKSTPVKVQSEPREFLDDDATTADGEVPRDLVAGQSENDLSASTSVISLSSVDLFEDSDMEAPETPIKCDGPDMKLRLCRVQVNDVASTLDINGGTVDLSRLDTSQLTKFGLLHDKEILEIDDEEDEVPTRKRLATTTEHNCRGKDEIQICQVLLRDVAAILDIDDDTVDLSLLDKSQLSEFGLLRDKKVEAIDYDRLEALVRRLGELPNLKRPRIRRDSGTESDETEEEEDRKKPSTAGFHLVLYLRGSYSCARGSAVGGALPACSQWPVASC